MKRMLIAAVAVGLALAAVSCSRGDRAIARVGDQKVTVAEFEQYYQAPAMAADTAEVSSAKRKLLDQLVDEKLMYCEALARGYDKDPQTARELAEIANNVLLDWLYREEFLKKNRASDRAVKDLYARLGVQVRARHIVVKTEAEAKQLAAAVRDKKTFERQFAGKTFDEEVLVPDPTQTPSQTAPSEPNQIPAGTKLEKRTVSGATLRERFLIVASQRSQEEMTAAKGGDLYWFGWGQVAPGFEPFQDAAFGLKPGQMSAPVKTPYGYHIIFVDSTKKTELPPLDQIKDRLKMQLDQQGYAKAGGQAKQYVSELLAKAKITVDSGTVALLAERQRSQYGGGAQPFPALSPDEMKRAAATYQGGTLTCADLADGAVFFFRNGMDLTSADSVLQYAERIVSRRLLAERARSLGLERLPKVRRHLLLKRTDKLAGMVYQRQVQEKVGVGDDEVAQYFKLNAKEFYRPALAYVDMIVTRTEAEAAAAAAAVRQGANFGAVARERSIDESRQAGGYVGPIPREFPAAPEVAARAFALPLNTVSPPFPARGGYAVIKVSKRDAARQPRFDEVKDQARSMLMQKQHDRLFQDLVAELKGKYPVTVDQRLLAAAGQQKEAE